MFEGDNKDQTLYDVMRVCDDDLSGSFSRETNSTREPRNAPEAGRRRAHTATMPNLPNPTAGGSPGVTDPSTNRPSYQGGEESYPKARQRDLSLGVLLLGHINLKSENAR
jgi:hypothetical protein